MDLAFIGDQLGDFSTFAGGLKKIFNGFAAVFDAISGAATAEKYDATPDTSKLEALSSNKSK